MTKEQAIRLYGSATKLAEALGVTKAAVSMWKSDQIPKHHELRLRYELKPDGVERADQ